MCLCVIGLRRVLPWHVPLQSGIQSDWCRLRMCMCVRAYTPHERTQEKAREGASEVGRCDARENVEPDVSSKLFSCFSFSFFVFFGGEGANLVAIVGELFGGNGGDSSSSIEALTRRQAHLHHILGGSETRKLGLAHLHTQRVRRKLQELLRCQYLNFCTIKASKMSTCSSCNLAWSFGACFSSQSTCTHTNTHKHTLTHLYA